MKKFSKLLASLLAVILLAGSMTSCDLPFFDETGSFIGLNDIINLLSGKNSDDFMESENYAFTSGMLKFSLVCDYMDFRSTYGQLLPYIGIDENVPLDEQLYGQNGIPATVLGEFNGTWLQFFAERLEDEAYEALLFYEYAIENGISVDVEVSGEQISEYLSLMSNAPASVSDIALSVTADDISHALKLLAVADRAKEHLMSNIESEIGDAQIQEIYEGNRDEYDAVDYISYTFELSLDDLEHEFLDMGYEDAEARARKAFDQRRQELINEANALAATKTPDEFYSFLTQRDAIAPDEFAELAHVGVKKASLPQKATEWAFDGSAGDTLVLNDVDRKDEYSMTVYMLTKAPYALRTKNFTYFLFTDKETAQNAVNSYVSGEVSSFDGIETLSKHIVYEKITNYDQSPLASPLVNSVVTTYPISGTVSGSYVINTPSNYYSVTEKATDGKNYAYVYTDGFVASARPSLSTGNADAVATEVSAELNNWLYSDKLTVGDHTVEPIRLSACYLIAYFEGDGEYSWYMNIKKDLTDEKFEQASAELGGKYSVTVFSSVISALS